MKTEADYKKQKISMIEMIFKIEYSAVPNSAKAEYWKNINLIKKSYYEDKTTKNGRNLGSNEPV